MISNNRILFGYSIINNLELRDPDPVKAKLKLFLSRAIDHPQHPITENLAKEILKEPLFKESKRYNFQHQAIEARSCKDRLLVKIFEKSVGFDEKTQNAFLQSLELFIPQKSIQFERPFSLKVTAASCLNQILSSLITKLAMTAIVFTAFVYVVIQIESYVYSLLPSNLLQYAMTFTPQHYQFIVERLSQIIKAISDYRYYLGALAFLVDTIKNFWEAHWNPSISFTELWCVFFYTPFTSIGYFIGSKFMTVRKEVFDQCQNFAEYFHNLKTEGEASYRQELHSRCQAVWHEIFNLTPPARAALAI